MNWGDDYVRAHLLVLWKVGHVHVGAKLAVLAEHLNEAGLIAQAARRNEFVLPAAQRGKFAGLLSRVWPSWQETLCRLEASGEAVSRDALMRLRRGRVDLDALPARLNRKTYAALVAKHSKAAVDAPGSLVLTSDDVLRLRLPQGMLFRDSEGNALGGDHVMAVFGELVLPERALLSGLHVEGRKPRCLMTVENPAAYVDMARPEGLLLIHQPGWNSRLSQRFIALLSDSIPWYHFGDLDPEGLDIFQSLGAEKRRPALWIPSFWERYIPSHGLRMSAPWPSETAQIGDPPILASLVREQCWLEQEAIVTAPALLEELIELTEAAGQ